LTKFKRSDQVQIIFKKFILDQDRAKFDYCQHHFLCTIFFQKKKEVIIIIINFFNLVVLIYIEIYVM
jgi:hypothetical protein